MCQLASARQPHAHSWITRRLRTLGDRLFLASDREATAQGWETHRIRFGFGRSYRDPRWARFVRCGACAGTGIPATTGQLRCVACHGTGRLDRSTPAWSGPR